jgi:hypothetical protein
MKRVLPPPLRFRTVPRLALPLLLLLLPFGTAACEAMAEQETEAFARMLEAAVAEQDLASGSAASPLPPPGTTPAQARDFAGAWEQTLEGVTHQEILEISVSGNAVAGTLTEIARGYFSSRSRITAQYGLQGTLRDGMLELRLWDGDSSPEAGFPARMYRRGEYLVLQIDDAVYGYARPGKPLVGNAQGSAEAERYARAIVGRVYGTNVQVSGRDRAVTGARVRLALCGDGSIAYDRSDLASAGGYDIGETVVRRGVWSVVLYAGAPAVRAEWEGSGSTHDLVQYFQVAPSADTRSAVVNGVRLPVTDNC